MPPEIEVAERFLKPHFISNKFCVMGIQNDFLLTYVLL